MDPTGVLLAFGAAMIATGLIYRTPVPVQPMKAQAAQSFVISPAAVYGAGLATGLIWLVLGLTGLASFIAKAVPRFVTMGIVLGLGMAFMLEGIKMMAGHWLMSAIGLVGTVLLLTNRRIPAMFVLLLFGTACGLWQHPAMPEKLQSVSLEFRLPEFAWAELTWNDLYIGVLFLALPQLPMTLGNAFIALRQENNRQFPDRPLSERKIAISTRILNVAGSAIGGVPMCHGAGGMAGHVAFGARTGGAVVILGVVLVILALFLASSVETFLRVLATPILGVILFLTGAQLALGSCDFPKDTGQRFITLVTAAFSIWNVGIAFVVAVSAAWIARRGLLRL